MNDAGFCCFMLKLSGHDDSFMGSTVEWTLLPVFNWCCSVQSPIYCSIHHISCILFHVPPRLVKAYSRQPSKSLAFTGSAGLSKIGKFAVHGEFTRAKISPLLPSCRTIRIQIPGSFCKPAFQPGSEYCRCVLCYCTLACSSLPWLLRWQKICTLTLWRGSATGYTSLMVRLIS